MDKYVEFEIDCKKVVACVVQKDEREIYQTIGPDIESMRKFLLSQKRSADKVELAFDMNGRNSFW